MLFIDNAHPIKWQLYLDADRDKKKTKINRALIKKNDDECEEKDSFK
jgi:hypothetical protein